MFSSVQLARRTQASGVAVSKLLKRMDDEGTIARVMRGLWANPRHTLFSPYIIVGHLAAIWRVPTYVSSISALHLHDMLSQIPQEIHVVTADARPARDTPVGRFVFHRLESDLLEGTQPGDKWGRFEIATPEKALFDTLYLGLAQGTRWQSFPEIEIPAKFKWAQWDQWIERIAFVPFRVMMERARDEMGGTRRRRGAASRGTPSIP
ncbi:type IV toxin-antitoxin system AbiEi family antitoxin domain-containing protein [Gemmatimonas sp.]|uniref:type IV toxin-antitoxin system AbiEi family antitoxin domain-containing protein n=1 Tax=Gemmatimonas sp. TaxID=1962908 RepID=UPI003F702370